MGLEVDNYGLAKSDDADCRFMEPERLAERILSIQGRVARMIEECDEEELSPAERRLLRQVRDCLAQAVDDVQTWGELRKLKIDPASRY